MGGLQKEGQPMREAEMVEVMHNGRALLLYPTWWRIVFPVKRASPQAVAVRIGLLPS